MALIKCTECGKEISDKAASCPHCGFPLTPNYYAAASTNAKPKKKRGCLISVLIFLFLMVAGIASMIFTGKQINDNIQQEISGTSSDEEYISLNEYNQIDTGMSYEEVKEIVGSAGTISSQVESGGYKIVIVTWYGNGVAGSNANVTFTNNEVTAKAQVGLVEDFSEEVDAEENSEKSVVNNDTSALSDESADVKTVTLVIPDYFVDVFEMEPPADDHIIERYRNEDNSLTLIFDDQEFYDAFVSGFRYSIISNLDEIRARENSPFEAIEHNDNLTSFTFTTRSSDLANDDYTRIVSALIMSAFYQILIGFPEEEVDVVFTTIDSLSGSSNEFMSWKSVKDQLIETFKNRKDTATVEEPAKATTSTTEESSSVASEVPRTPENPNGLDPKTYQENIVYFNDVSSP